MILGRNPLPRNAITKAVVEILEQATKTPCKKGGL
jgi:hypothetical protein